ncbi:YolD-like family protein [Brevibacillus porteri]|uniref:YolD-like family protein n=1 Tax=Brevibacillus porteri TaxID=2126350 RepID=UPI00362B3BD0
MREKRVSKKENVFVASRFVLPEHREMYLQVKEDEKLVTMPIVEQDELESLNYVICDSARADYAITVTWWKQVKGSLGTICTMWGVVKWFDQNGRRIKLVTDEDSQWISMDHITAVKAD